MTNNNAPTGVEEGAMFPEYHKIHSIWKRTERGVFVPWDWSRPELGYLAGLDWQWTEKVDGTNIRIGLVEGGTIRIDADEFNEALEIEQPRTYRVGGRTDRAQIPASLLDAIAALDLEPKLRKQFDGPVTLYGEGYGAKIQKGGGNYRPDQGFVLFDVRVGRWWLEQDAVNEIGAALGLDVAPVRGVGTLDEAIEAVAPGMESTWGDFEAEGVVCRPVVPLFARDGKRVICKVKTVDFRRLEREGVDWRGAR